MVRYKPVAVQVEAYHRNTFTLICPREYRYAAVYGMPPQRAPPFWLVFQEIGPIETEHGFDSSFACHGCCTGVLLLVCSMIVMAQMIVMVEMSLAEMYDEATQIRWLIC